ncbi:Transporter of the ATP-binding cassette (ABC), partial [Coemansia sp. Benny D160-2]
MLVESGHDDDGSENDSTPLAHMNDLKTSSLVDSPEQFSSWFDKLTFLWLTNLLRRGAAKPINSSDLYNLKPSDVPVHNWKRYQKYRKPGRSLIVTLGLTYAPELLAQFALTMVLCVSRFANPFFLQRILRSIEFTQQQ